MMDIFRPHSEPAASIYDAFQREAKLRYGRTVEKWIACERDAVHTAATDQAFTLNLHAPTMDEIISAERLAYGHVDYGA